MLLLLWTLEAGRSYMKGIKQGDFLESRRHSKPPIFHIALQTTLERQV